MCVRVGVNICPNVGLVQQKVVSESFNFSLGRIIMSRNSHYSDNTNVISNVDYYYLIRQVFSTIVCVGVTHNCFLQTNYDFD